AGTGGAWRALAAESDDAFIYTCIIRSMEPIHAQVLDAACVLADNDGTFRIADLARALPHLNAATVRTHVASRCCVNAPSNHHSRYRYFRALRRGVYRIERPFRRRARIQRRRASQDVLLDSLDSGVDLTLIAESLAMTPTMRMETMRRAALSLDAIRAR
ncbi:MAG: hypothetical protein ACRD2A_21490, partial [Vicinamibacterales bacterium]